MKRPQGFDSPSADSPSAARKSADRPSAARRKPVRRKSVPSTIVTPKTPAAPAPKGEHRASEKKVKKAPRVNGASLRTTARERRRFERREIRRFTRRTRHRRLTWSVLLVTVAMLSGLLAVAIYSPLLALRSIVVVGVSTVSAEDIHDAIGGQIGTPLALLDYDSMRSGLDSFPRVRSFSTEIVPPSTLKVHIVERAPVGVISSASGFQIVDPAGVVLESALRRPDSFPLIELADEGTDSVAFTAVVDVILALPESIRSQVDVAQATSKDDVRLVLSDSGQRVRWGSSERSALKARVLVELMATQGTSSLVEFDVSAPLSPVVRDG